MNPLFSLFAILFLATGCSSKMNEKDKKRLLPITMCSEVRSLDPSIGIDDASEIIIKMLFEGLVTIDLSGNLIPAAAERYEISPDLKTYTFFLRDSLWSNGSPVTAYDFEYAWKRIITGGARGTAVHNCRAIKNVKLFLEGKKSIDEVGIKAVDQKTFLVELEHPTLYFLEVIATSSFFPINAEVDKKTPNWMHSENEIVGNGPFVLATHKYNNEIVVLKNPRYWDREHVKLEGIKIAIIEAGQAPLQMFEKNEVAWIGKPLSRIPLDALPALKKRGELICTPAMGIYWYFFNTEAFPFHNKKMRKAFAYAIHREEITGHILQEGERPALGVLSPSLGVSQEPYFSDYNLEGARKLFAEALQEMGITKEKLPAITLSYNASELHARTAQVVQSQWEKAFGIRVTLQPEEWKVHYQNLVKGNFQIGGMGWASCLRDPSYIMQTFRYRSDGVNMSRWENPTYQALLDATETETNREKRRRTFYEAEKLLMEEMPIIPMYFTSICYAKKKNLKDVYVSELNQLDFRWAEYEPAR